MSGGLGNAPAGIYQVEVSLRSHKRYSVYTWDDNPAHHQDYCRYPDLPIGSCSSEVNIDGVKLSSKNIAVESGLAPSYAFPQGRLEGSLNHESGGKWEWPEDDEIAAKGLPRSVRWTFRSNTFLTLRYNLSWTGARIDSRIRAQWKESDQWPSKDKPSEWATFNVGDMLTRCLQQGHHGYGSYGGWFSVLPNSADYFWHLCSEEGNHCTQASGSPDEIRFPDTSGNRHFNVAVFYNVSCRSLKVTTCGNGVCEPGESAGTCQDCGVLPTCGNFVCEAGENQLNCPHDCLH